MVFVMQAEKYQAETGNGDTLPEVHEAGNQTKSEKGK